MVQHCNATWNVVLIYKMLNHDWTLGGEVLEASLSTKVTSNKIAGLKLGLRLANERRRYKVTPSLIGLAQS